MCPCVCPHTLIHTHHTVPSLVHIHTRVHTLTSHVCIRSCSPTYSHPLVHIHTHTYPYVHRYTLNTQSCSTRSRARTHLHTLCMPYTYICILIHHPLTHIHSLHIHSHTCTYWHTDIHMFIPSHTHPCTLPSYTSPHTSTPLHTLHTPLPTHILMQPIHTLPSSTHVHSHSLTCTHSYPHSFKHAASHTCVAFLISLPLRNCSCCRAGPLQPPQRVATNWGLDALGRGTALL